MNIKDKLKIILKVSSLTQTELAKKIGVSFVTVNKWINGRAAPRPKMETVVNELYLEVTGQRTIPEDYLSAKKELILSRREGHRDVLREIVENPDIRDEFILKLTYHSNSMEGSTLTENDTAAVIFDNIALPNKSLVEQLEAKNHQAALNYLFYYILGRGKINEFLILKLHGILMNGIIHDAGSYRNHAVRILGSEVPTANYFKVTNLIADLVKDINKSSKDVVSLVSAVHSRFEQIHPFSDGNGRIGRMIIQAMLLRDNFAPAIVRQEKKNLYYIYLNKSQIKNDLTQLEDFVCDAVLYGFDILERKSE